MALEGLVRLVCPLFPQAFCNQQVRWPPQMADIHHTRPREGEGLRKVVLRDKLINAKSNMLHLRLLSLP